MLKSLYSYKGTHARTLAFSANEKFLEIGQSKDSNWVHVISENGNLGFVPKNYVAIDQVPPIEMLSMIDACIEGIHLLASERGGNYSRFEHEALQALVDMRQEWHAKIPSTMHPSKRPAPPPPSRTTSHRSVDSIGSTVSDGSLPSPSQPLVPSAPTPTALRSPFPSESSLHQAPKRQGSEVEKTTSFIGRGDSLAEEDVTPNAVLPKCSTHENAKEAVPARTISQTTSTNNELIKEISDLEKCVPNDYCRQLVEEIRSNTNISFTTSQQVVELVFNSLQVTFPPLAPLLKKILTEECSKKSLGNSLPHSQWESSSDGRKLVELLETLRQCKDDGQQRSWALHEDEFTIKSHLNQLLEILTNGDLEVCNQVLMLDDHRPILTLVQFYQMETRWNLRKLLLHIFTNICQMSKENISYLSASILPLELTREILDSRTSADELQYITLVLGMILSMGDTLPFTHFSIMNESFVKNLLEGIETYTEVPDTENLGELFMTLLLAFNLQYHTALSYDSKSNQNGTEPENLIIKVLSKQNNSKYFIEKLLLHFNREEDPVRMFDHEPQPPHSVLCMMRDVFSSPTTAQLLYTNDEMVLCDIILRQLTDLSPEDKRRQKYLCLLEGVVTLGRWKEHKHRKKELHSRLLSIQKQDEFPADSEAAGRILSAIAGEGNEVY